MRNWFDGGQKKRYGARMLYYILEIIVFTLQGISIEEISGMPGHYISQVLFIAPKIEDLPILIVNLLSLAL